MKKTRPDLSLIIEKDLRVISEILINNSLHLEENWYRFHNGPNNGYGVKSRLNKAIVGDENVTLDGFNSSKAFYRHLKDYLEYKAQKDFAFMLNDGALIQIEYLFLNDTLSKQRLAYIQNPLELSEYDYQSFSEDDGIEKTEEILLEELEFSDSTSNSGLVNFRFDYDPREKVAKELIHPRMHLTLSNSDTCRIPVSGPMTSLQFVKMIIDHFYPDQREGFDKEVIKKKGAFHEKNYPASFFAKENDVFRVLNSK